MKYRIITLIGPIEWFTGGILLPAVFGKSPKSENGVHWKAEQVGKGCAEKA